MSARIDSKCVRDTSSINVGGIKANDREEREKTKTHTRKSRVKTVKIKLLW